MRKHATAFRATLKMLQVSPTLHKIRRYRDHVAKKIKPHIFIEFLEKKQIVVFGLEIGFTEGRKLPDSYPSPFTTATDVADSGDTSTLLCAVQRRYLNQYAQYCAHNSGVDKGRR